MLIAAGIAAIAFSLGSYYTASVVAKTFCFKCGASIIPGIIASYAAGADIIFLIGSFFGVAAGSLLYAYGKDDKRIMEEELNRRSLIEPPPPYSE